MNNEKDSIPPTKPKQPPDASDTRDLVLCHEDAQGGCPDDMAACGEEDIGVGLEDLVTEHKPRESQRRR